jgi:four helix bundle protein
MADSHKDLIVWQKAMALVTDVYASTAAFPRQEMYGLTNQLRRAAVSVPSNIAEGKGRLSKREYVQFLSRARGSLLELDTQLHIARNLGYLNETEFHRLSTNAEEVGRALNGLLSAIVKQLDSPESSELRADWDYKRLKGNKIEYLKNGGPVLGPTPDATYTRGFTILEPGDLACLYSDGVVEAHDAKDREFGLDRLQKLVKANRTRSSQEIGQEVLARIAKWGREGEDDRTVMIVKAVTR